MICIPCSSYSFLVIHSWWNVPRLASTEPPSQDAYLRSKGMVGECILIFCCGRQCVLSADQETYAGHEGRELEVEPLGQPADERAVANDDNVLQQRRAHVDVARHDRVVHELREGHEVFERARVRGVGDRAERGGWLYPLRTSALYPLHEPRGGKRDG